MSNNKSIEFPDILQFLDISRTLAVVNQGMEQLSFFVLIRKRWKDIDRYKEDIIK